MSVQANLETFEGTASSPITCTFARKSRRVIIFNDSSTNDLKWKLNESEDYATLKPTELVSLEIHVRQVHLLGNGDYRVWVTG